VNAIACHEPQDTALSDNSKITIVASENSETPGIFQMKVFPNPNNGMFTIEVNMPAVTQEQVKLKIINVLGQEVFTKEFTVNNDYIKEVIELDSSLKTGIYTLQLTVGSKSKSTSIVLSK
jgi:hypothetical protein